MKINILEIITAHLNTLHEYKPNDAVKNHKDAKCDNSRNKLARDDLSIFFFLPILAAILLAIFGPALTEEAYTISVSIFAIFSALLLNVQIALFSIYHRSWSQVEDNNLQKIKNDKQELRRSLIRQLNTNISYSIIISCTSVMVFFFLYIFKYSSFLSSSICYFLFLHFFLTLIMIIKRAHALFDTEYTEENKNAPN